MLLHLADKYFDPSVDKTVKKIRGKRGKCKPRKNKSNQEALIKNSNVHDDVSKTDSIPVNNEQLQMPHVLEKEGKVTF